MFQLTRSSNALKSQLDTLPPQAIQSECEKLASHRNELNLLDDQLIDILALTGADSSLSGMIDNYSIALMKARIACDKLYHRLADLKKGFQEKSCRILSCGLGSKLLQAHFYHCCAGGRYALFKTGHKLRLRSNDLSCNWIPAYAGMTTLWCF